MNHEEVQSVLRELKVNLADLCVSGAIPGLVLALHFGSTVHGPVKYTTDIDLFLVFETVPKNKFERQQLANIIERHADPFLQKLKREGFDVLLAPVIQCGNALNQFRAFYLDLPEHSHVLFQKDDVGDALIQRIREFRIRYNARVESAGGNRVWVYRGDIPAGQPFTGYF